MKRRERIKKSHSKKGIKQHQTNTLILHYHRSQHQHQPNHHPQHRSKGKGHPNNNNNNSTHVELHSYTGWPLAAASRFCLLYGIFVPARTAQQPFRRLTQHGSNGADAGDLSVDRSDPVSTAVLSRVHSQPTGDFVGIKTLSPGT